MTDSKMIKLGRIFNGFELAESIVWIMNKLYEY